MSFWVHAFCNESVESVTPDELITGIARRLKLLTYLFCPDDEEDPEAVLSRVRIENPSGDPFFGLYQLRYRSNSGGFIPIGRNGRGAILELDEELAHRREPGVQRIREMLREASDHVTFSLRSSDVSGMGFPLCIAAAAYLVELKGGVIQSGTYSWMAPHGNEVRTILEIQA